jgi:hypothetical protein
MMDKRSSRKTFLQKANQQTLYGLKKDRLFDISFSFILFAFSVFYFFYGYKLISDYLNNAHLLQFILRYGMPIGWLSLSWDIAKKVGYLFDINNELKRRAAM